MTSRKTGAPKGAVGHFEDNGQTVHVIPRKGENPEAAKARVAARHGKSPKDVQPGKT